MIHRINWASLALLLILPVLIIGLGRACWPHEPAEQPVIPSLLYPEPANAHPAAAVMAAQAVNTAETHRPAPQTKLGVIEDEPIALTNDAFSFTADMTGRIRYFSGRFNRRGYWLPQDPNRFLGLEKIDFIITFNQPPYQFEVDLAGQVTLLAGHPGRTVYTFWLIMPDGPDTLDWHNQRLRQPHTVNISAVAWYDRSLTASSQINGVELTGSVYQIVHVQPEPSP